MIRAEFVISENSNFLGFSVSGHAGFSEAPGDIVCAAVSSMTTLVINTVSQAFGAEISVVSDEKKPLVKAMLKSGAPDGAGLVIKGFFLQMADLEKQYPANLKVTTTHI